MIFLFLHLINLSFLWFLINHRRWPFSVSIWAFIWKVTWKLLRILIFILSIKILRFNEILFVILTVLALLYIVYLFLISFRRDYFLISWEKALIEDLSVICLSSVENIMNWWLFLFYEVDFIWSLSSSHWVLRVDLSLLKCAYSFDWRVWSRQPKVTVIILPYMTSCFVTILFALLWSIYIRDLCLILNRTLTLKLFWGVFLLWLLSWIWIALIPCIHLISNLNISLWRRRWRHSAWGSLPVWD